MSLEALCDTVVLDNGRSLSAKVRGRELPVRQREFDRSQGKIYAPGNGQLRERPVMRRDRGDLVGLELAIGRIGDRGEDTILVVVGDKSQPHFPRCGVDVGRAAGHLPRLRFEDR